MCLRGVLLPTTTVPDKIGFMTLEEKARKFAAIAHAQQLRKYTGEAYVVHPIAVAEIVKSVPHTEEMVAAALLHDVVEDCGVTFRTIEELFGQKVAVMVYDLTDVSKPSDGNRKKRKEIDRLHTAVAHPNSKTIKLADLIDNTKSICEHDPDFARVYLKEKAELLEVLREGDSSLWNQANLQCSEETLNNALKRLEKKHGKN